MSIYTSEEMDTWNRARAKFSKEEVGSGRASVASVREAWRRLPLAERIRYFEEEPPSYARRQTLLGMETA